MKKPNNRRTRLEFIKLKLGPDIAQGMYLLTDKEVKKFFDRIYNSLKNKENYDYTYTPPTCIRCNEEVEIEFHSSCCCGVDRAIYSVEDWKRNVEDYSIEDRVKGDEEFINNGYSLKEI